MTGGSLEVGPRSVVLLREDAGPVGETQARWRVTRSNAADHQFRILDIRSSVTAPVTT